MKILLRIGVVITVLLTILTVILGVGYLKLNPHAPASQAFLNGHIITMDKNNSVHEAVFLKDNKIFLVGNNKDVQALMNEQTVIVDLKGQTMMPGIIDAHGHYPGQGIAAVGLDLNSPPIGHVVSIKQSLNMIKEKVVEFDAQEWVIGYGYDDTAFTEQRHFNRIELDAVSPNHPLMLMHISGHMGVFNSAALALLNIDESTPNPVGGEYVKDATTGKLNGLVYETAFAQARTIVTKFPLGTILKISSAASDAYLEKGVTTAQNGLTLKSHMASLSYSSKIGISPLRVVAWPNEEYGHEIVDGKESIAALAHDKFYLGAIKIVADGSLQLYTGFLTEPYHSTEPGKATPHTGYPSIEGAELKATITKFHKSGYQLAIHGNGDAAIDSIINAIDAAQKEHYRADPRHIIIHAQTLREDQMNRMLALGITPSFFSAHTYYWGDRHRETFLGEERASRISPTNTALKKGLRFTTHLDSPIVPMDPMLMVWSTVNRLTSSGKVLGAGERISVMQALRATTIDAAWQIFKEDLIGSIEKGKLADLVILQDNPLDDPANIKDILVNKTIIDGVTVYDRAL
jgi:predicted amidohydrolase YtcJ